MKKTLCFIFSILLFIQFVCIKDIQAQKFKKVKPICVINSDVEKIVQKQKDLPLNEFPIFKAPPNNFEQKKNYKEPILRGVKIVKNSENLIPDNYFSDNVSIDAQDDFNGLTDPGYSIPPDVNGAIGENHIVVTLNAGFAFLDRKGKRLGATSMYQFFKSIPQKSSLFDPKVLYDEFEDRWMITCCDGSNPKISRLLFAVSKTPDPTKSWTFYILEADPDKLAWLDYPSMGFNKKWIGISGNMYGAKNYVVLFLIDKKRAYAGEKDPGIYRLKTTQRLTIVPAVTHDNEEEDLYCASTGSGEYKGGGLLTVSRAFGPVDNPEYEILYYSQGRLNWENNPSKDYNNFLPQKGSSRNISAVDTRLQKLVYRNKHLYAVHTAFRPIKNPKRTTALWWHIDLRGNVINQGVVEDLANKEHYAFPNIDVNKYGDLVVGVGIFNKNQYASAGYAFRAADDDRNTIRKPYQYKDGKATYYKTFGSGRNRWGDYSAVAVDPKNDSDFYVLQEYAESKSSNDRWGTWWAKVSYGNTMKADFIALETEIPEGGVANFEDQSTRSPESWEWIFEGGEPSTSTMQNPKGITYKKAGDYKVSLKIMRGSDEAIEEKEAVIHVKENLLPISDFYADKKGVCLNEKVSFVDISSNQPTEWLWSINPTTYKFVNGTSEKSKNPIIQFTEEGAYSVELTTKNKCGEDKKAISDYLFVGNIPLGEKNVFHETFGDKFENLSWGMESSLNNSSWEQVIMEYDIHDTVMKLNLKNSSIFNEKERLISPEIEFQKRDILSFEYAYTCMLNFNAVDTLKIYYSADCSDDWKLLKSYYDRGYGNFRTADKMDYNFLPEPGQWYKKNSKTQIEIPLNEIEGSSIRFAFEVISDGGNAFYLDDIKLLRKVGLEEISSKEISISPNPSNGSFTLIAKEELKKSLIKIYDVKGNLVSFDIAQNGLNQYCLELSEKNEGAYFLIYKDHDKIFSKKIIITK
ncbi:MAG: T9SS type A sorting domain-containing protein [Bacteroidales bacterium]